MAMATVSQIRLQKEVSVRYTGGEAVLPQEPSPLPDPMLVIGGQPVPDGSDFGVVKVEAGGLIIDSDDFNVDFKTFA
jgi:hypothetical protein